MKRITIGKHVLESLSTGMYSNPLDIYREYIQNSTDSIDSAYKASLLKPDEGEIFFTVDTKKNSVTILDNGVGIPVILAAQRLNDIGNSQKHYATERGFRGIGRLGGLGYAKQLQFETSAHGETQKTVITWDCVRLRELLSPSNKEKQDIFAVMEEVVRVSVTDNEDLNSHFFCVQLIEVDPVFTELLDHQSVHKYLASVAPVDFDSQHFPEAGKIKNFFESRNAPMTCYKIFKDRRDKPIYKLYTRSLITGMQQRTKNKDYIKDVEFVEEKSNDGHPLFIGWLAVTDFSGQINDELLQGLRLRKGNILVGDNTTFARFFPSEGSLANKMFAGEIHILHPDIIPNAKRDDFEPSEKYQELSKKLSDWAGLLNRNYRRGSSKFTSAVRALNKALSDQDEIQKNIKSGSITSDTRRDKFKSDLDRIQKNIVNAKKEIENTAKRGVVAPENKAKVKNYLEIADKSIKKCVTIENLIINADYATKNDLPTSYSRDERKVYQKIIEIIDTFFINDQDTAKRLRDVIRSELSAKKK